MKISYLCLITLFCLALQGTVAAVQENTGVQDGAATDAAPVPDDHRSVQAYRALINKQQKEHGPYDPQLGEQYLGLGLVYRNEGKYEEAAKALDQALHIKRVNDGVESLSQLPVLEALIDVNTLAGNWEELDRNYDLLLQVNQRHLSEDNPVIQASIDKVSRWKFLAYNQKLLKKKPELQLNDMIQVHKSTIKIIEELYGKEDPRLIKPLNNLGLVHYLLLEDINNRALGEFQGNSAREHMERVCRPVLTRFGVIMSCSMELVSNPDYFYSRQTNKTVALTAQATIIKNLLNRIIKIIQANPAIPPRQLAQGLVTIGDWYFLYNMKNTAMTTYKRAFELLMLDGSGADEARQVFGQPKRIPSFPGYASIGDISESDESQPYVRLSIDVGKDGKASKIDVIKEANTRNFMPRKKARAQIKSWLFRPRFENGEPVVTHDMVVELSGEILRKAVVQGSGHTSVTGSRIWR